MTLLLLLLMMMLLLLMLLLLLLEPLNCDQNRGTGNDER